MTMGARILVVDDNPHDRSLVAFLAGAFGHSVTVTSSGAEAVDTASRERFDLVLVDLLMPEMDGYDTMAALRKVTALANVPIVALTILSGVEQRREALTRGFDGHIPKPIFPEGFESQLAAFLSGAIGERGRPL